MLNATEAEAAMKALPFPNGLKSKAEYRAEIRAYNEGVGAVLDEFKGWLANEYAFTLPAAIQDRIWSKAWSESHEKGYSALEKSYLHHAELAKFVFNAE